MDMLLLVSISFIASVVSGVTGLGGGMILIAGLGQVLPPAALLPVHGLIQVVSNGSRIALGLKVVHWPIFYRFFVGAILGGLVGFFLVSNIDPRIFGISISIYLISAIWVPYKITKFNIVAKLYPILGFLSSILSIFIGVSGPLIHPVLAKDSRIKKESFIATEAACSGFTHLIKFFVFSLVDFEYSQYFQLLIYLSLATVFGIAAGTKILKKIDDRKFHLLIKIIVTGMAIRMLALHI